MAVAPNYDAMVRIYAIASPTLITQASDAVQRLVFEALQVAPSAQRRLTISESSGWLDYTVVNELWDRISPPVLPLSADAQSAADDLLSRLEQKCSDANPNWPASLRGIALMPPVNLLKRAELKAVPRPGEAAWDHWLVRYEPQLYLDGSAQTRAGVFGAQVEVRIGHLGQIISLRSRWCPLSGERKLADLKPAPPPASAANTQASPPPPVLNFLLEGDSIPQYYLAPYYFQSDGDDISMISASPYSLTVDIGRTRQQSDQMTLTALAQGGSGDYLYNWAAYSLADSEEGLHELGGGQLTAIDTDEGKAVASSLELDNGYYIVMVNVKDRLTGAFKHHQQQVFASAFLSQSDLVA